MKHGISDPNRLPQRVTLLGLALVLSLSFGCGKGDQTATDSDQPRFEVADTKDARTASQDVGMASGDTATQDAAPAPSMDPIGSGQPPSIASDQLNSTEVPDGTPEELLAFIGKMDAQGIPVLGQLMNPQRQGGPAVGGQAAMIAKLRAIYEATLTAAEKIMAAADVDSKTRKEAIEAKLKALSILAQADPGPSWGEKIRSFATLLAADKDPDISRQGRTITFSLRVGELAQNQDSDFAGFMSDLKTLLSDEGKSQEVLDAAQQAAMALNTIGRNEDALKAMRMAAEAYKDHTNPALVKQAANILAQLKLVELDIDSKFNAVVEKKEGAPESLLEAVKTALKGPDLGPVVLQKFIRISQNQPSSLLEMLEQTGNYELGAQIGTLVKDAVANGSDEQLKPLAAQATDLILRRLNLIGKPLVIEGSKLDGSAFDFTKYKGKVILVDFWATWCGPCVAELPNILENYTKYHDKGFDVIGLNLDQSPQTAQEFLASRKFPWDNVIGKDLAEKCGVESIPFVVLLNQDGIVVDLHVRGATLGEKLAELLGPAVAEGEAEPTVPLTPPE